MFPPLNPDSKILQRLFTNAPDAVPSATLAAQIGLSEKELLPRIEELRRAGYDIEWLPHTGYSMREASDVLVADEIQARLPGHPMTQSVLIFKETRSTNDLAHRYGREGHPGPLLIAAESQTHGRGRQGRSWNSKPQLGLWFSLLFRPQIPVQQTQRLTIQACLALHRAIQKSCQLHAEIKWPNDLLYKGRKLAGILTEAHLEGARLSYAIVGIGCNINHQSEDFPPELQNTATSLALISGQKSRRADLLVEFLPQFQRILQEDWESVREEWKSHCLNMGRAITLRIREESITGQMIDMNEDGALVFRHASGRLETIHAGEILSQP